MQFHIFDPVSGSNHVNRILNSYLYQLCSLEKVALPQSMGNYAVLTESDDPEAFTDMATLLYQVCAVGAALPRLAECLSTARMEMEFWLEEYNGDFQAYAASKRIEDAELNGYLEPADVSPDGEQLVPRTEPEALVPYQLHRVLAAYFTTGQPGRDERIGSSTAADFLLLSNLVRGGLVYGLRDEQQPATPANLTTYPPDEAQQPDDPEAPEEEELFFDEQDVMWPAYVRSLAGLELVDQFEALLARCQQAASQYHSLAPDDAAGHRQLLSLITEIIEGTTG